MPRIIVKLGLNGLLKESVETYDIPADKIMLLQILCCSIL